MAKLSTITCDTCGHSKEVWHGSGDTPPKTCSECTQLKEDSVKRAYLGNLAKLPTDERLRKIEEFIYDHTRNHPHTPPRF